MVYCLGGGQMIVGRVEPSRGRGPYNDPACTRTGPLEPVDAPHHPAPWSEPELLAGPPLDVFSPNKAWIFGFPSYAALCAWWSAADLLQMDEKLCSKLFVSLYDAPRFFTSEKQTLFFKPDSRRLFRDP